MSPDRKRETEFQLPPLTEVSLEDGVRVDFNRLVRFKRDNGWVVEKYPGANTLPLKELMHDFPKYKDAIKNNRVTFNPRSRSNSRIELNMSDPIYLLLSWDGRRLLHRTPALATVKVTEHGPFSEMSFYDAASLYSEPLEGGRTPFPAHPSPRSIYIPKPLAQTLA